MVELLIRELLNNGDIRGASVEVACADIVLGVDFISRTIKLMKDRQGDVDLIVQVGQPCSNCGHLEAVHG